MALNEQMELFSEGGLEQDGGTADPVSGNAVPPGSTQEEVRDDIPAQLSEGEFVFPADVVRYIGLENLMRMRQEAKMGLKMMDEMGQMGNSEEASIPDDVPFDLSDLDIEDDLSYNVGGFVPATQQEQQFGIAGVMPSQFLQPVQSYGTPTSGTPVTTYNAPQAVSVPTTYVPPQQAVVPTTTKPDPAPAFTDYVGQSKTENIEYINPTTGERRVFTFVNGEPTTAIPEGFIPLSQYKPDQTAVTTKPTVGTTSVREDDPSDPTEEPGGATVAFGGNLNNRGRVDGAYLGNISYEGLGLGEARSRATAGFGQFFSEDNVTPPLPAGATAIISNLKLPKNPGDIRPAEVMRARLQVDSDFFNKTIANTNVTDRRDLEKTVDYIRNKYKSNFLNDSDNIINVEQEFRQMQRDESDASARKQLAEARRKQERGDDSGFDRIVEAAVKQATKEVERDYDDEAASSVSVSQAELDAARQSAPTLSEARERDREESFSRSSQSFGIGSTGSGMPGTARAKGGFIDKSKPKAKKMKRGGLAFKK